MESSEKKGAKKGLHSFGRKPRKWILGSDHSTFSLGGRIETQGDSFPFWAANLKKGPDMGVWGSNPGPSPAF